MATTVWGVVKDGVVRLFQALPEGAWVQVVVPDGPKEFTPEEREEFDQLQAASARAFEHIVRLEQEEADAQG